MKDAMSENQEPEITDKIIAMGWLQNPPKLPPSKGPLEASYPPAHWLGANLSELVTEWKVSAVEAERVFASWANACRRLRRLLLSGKREMPRETELREAFRNELWAGEQKPTSARLRDIAAFVESLEQSENNVSLEWVSKMLSKPLKSSPRRFQEWLIRHWISPERDTPPLCLCSDSLIGEIITLKRDSSLPERGIPQGEALRRAICDLGLYRPKKPRLRKLPSRKKL